MKKVLVVLAVLLFASTLFAQEGKWNIGTSSIKFVNTAGEEFGPMTGFSQTKLDKDTKLTQFGLAPEVGYNINDKFSVGLGVYFTNQKLKEEGENDVKANMFGFNPYVRYYVSSVDKFKFYVQGGLDFTKLKTKQGSLEQKQTVWGIGVLPGIAYNVSEKFQLTASFGYLGYKDLDNDASEFGLNVDMSSLKFGLNYTF